VNSAIAFKLVFLCVSVPLWCTNPCYTPFERL